MTTRTPLPLTGPELRRYRTARGVSMLEVARRTGWSKGYLSHVETGRRPLLDHLRRDCLAALGADLTLDDPPADQMDHPPTSPSVRPCCGVPWENNHAAGCPAAEACEE